MRPGLSTLRKTSAGFLLGALGCAHSPDPQASGAPSAEEAPTEGRVADGKQPPPPTTPDPDEDAPEAGPLPTEQPQGPAQGKVCGGFAGATCGPEEYCAYEAGQHCGAADASSTCQPRPEVCTKIYRPVCGCDNKIYPSACMAATTGQGVLWERECSAPEERD